MKKTKWERFREILFLDKKAISQLYFFAILSGLLSLSLPLGIQSVVQYIQGGQIATSWVVLVILVVAGVIATGALQIMQLRITETLQQRIFVHFTFQFAQKFPRLNRASIQGKIPAELMNRFFDVMNVQKGISKLLLDFISASLQIIFSLLVLSFYHPFYIAFSIVLILAIYLVFRPIIKHGLKTSYEESNNKYKTVFWLQEIARSDWSLRMMPSAMHPMQRTDEHSYNYLNSRTEHFQILRKQYIWMVMLKAVIVASLLGLGGYLVIDQKVTVGQFIAAEVLILLVLGSFEKIIQLLETVYDVFTSLEKLGQIQDLPSVDLVKCDTKNLSLFPMEIFTSFKDEVKVLATVQEGKHVFVKADHQMEVDRFLRVLVDPSIGNQKVRWNNAVPNEHDHYSSLQYFAWYSKGTHLFDGTLWENVVVGRNNLTDDCFTLAMKSVGMDAFTQKYAEGKNVLLSKSNKILSEEQRERILIARGLINHPKLAIINFHGSAISEKDQLDLMNNLKASYPDSTFIFSSSYEALGEGYEIIDLLKF